MDTAVRTTLATRLVVSVAAALIVAALYAWAVRTVAGQQFDASSLALGATWRARWGEETLARSADIAPWIVVAAAGVAIALQALRGRWRTAVGAAALPVVVYVIATLLHDWLLPRPYLGDFGYAINTLPSERLAVVIACCCVLVWCTPRRMPVGLLVPVLAAAAGAIGALEVAAFSSRFADVVACAPLVATLAAWWFPLGLPRSRTSLGVVGAVALAAAAAGVALMLRWAGADYDPAAYTPSLIGVALCVIAGVSALSLVLRRPA